MKALLRQAPMWDATPPKPQSWERTYLWVTIWCTAAMLLALIWLVPVFSWGTDIPLASKLGFTAVGVFVTGLLAPAGYLIVREMMKAVDKRNPLSG